jgi:AraC-like DNA-binding protein/quercetin dioxygenase-like cupin family protein
MRAPSKHPWEDAYSVIEPQINADSVHVWPFQPEFPIDVRFLKFAPKSDIRMNRHDYCEILYVVSGAVTYQVQDQFYSLHAGDLFVMGSTLLHRISKYETSGMKAAVLYFMPDLLHGDSAGEQVEYLMPFLVQDTGFPHTVPAGTGVPDQIYDLIIRARRELPAASNRARLSVKTYLRMMLVLLVNHFSAWRGSEGVFDRQQRNLHRMQPVFEFIERRYCDPIGVDDAAAVLHMSKSAFMRFFKEVTGQSFIGYLNRFRVAKAEALLAETDLSILEISERAGFSDQSYFGLVFRNLLNMTPREYKQSRQQIRA